MVISTVFFVVILLAIYGISELINHLRYLNRERKWKKQSFEWHDWRVNKDFFEVVDGKLVQK
jgi:hypothetical protein